MISPMEVSLEDGSEVSDLPKPEGVSGRPAPSAADDKVLVSGKADSSSSPPHPFFPNSRVFPGAIDLFSVRS